MLRHHYRGTVIGILKIDINIIKMLQHDWTTDLQTRNFKRLKFEIAVADSYHSAIEEGGFVSKFHHL